jgi:aconitate hydratase
MTQRTFNAFGARSTFNTAHGPLGIYRLSHLEQTGVAKNIDRLPYAVRVLAEAVLRNCDGFEVSEEDVQRIANWHAPAPLAVELPFKPARVILQDFTGVPVLVDIAAMRSAVARLGGDPTRINPQVPVDLVIDHSVQVDHFGAESSLSLNLKLEFHRNRERYQFLRWGQNAVKNFSAVPPGMGIVHQVNVERLATVVRSGSDRDGAVAFPDTLVGTDSHTTMINGLGVVGWGVGGIEAEAVMLGQPLFMLTPQVVGMRLHGELREGVTATDLVLTITHALRKKGVVDKFVEFYGPALSQISVADRATVANMAPEYGATTGFFPVDQATLEFLRRTGRPGEVIDRVERYTKEQGMFWTPTAPEPVFSDTLELDLSTVEPSLAGPKRPQDRVALSAIKSQFRSALSAPIKDRGFALAEADLAKTAPVEVPNGEHHIGHGAVTIAAITSCTNTSNPSVLLAAGLVAQKAVAKGLRVPPHVKTSLAPGSRVVTDYLAESGTLPALEALGFNVVGYGCTTCIGNSGPLPENVAKAITEGNLVAGAVISGNRNFEGRVHPLVKANYLASPPLVVAFALAGTVDKDLLTEPIGQGTDGPVYLKDIWPTTKEVADAVERNITPAMYERTYEKVFEGTDEWKSIAAPTGDLYAWDEASTYIQHPPFFQSLTLDVPALKGIDGARVLALLGDSVTTDHISPAGDIAAKSPAGTYLQGLGVTKTDFNSYGSRRGNDRVMVRGTFANIRLKNALVPGSEGNITEHLPTGDKLSIYEASERYQAAGTPLIILAGKEYGTGSSRDWAAKGTLLLGVRAVIAESFERIHRANLVGMGVLPLVFKAGENAEALGLTGRESFTIEGIDDNISARQELTVRARRDDGSEVVFGAIARLDTPVDVLYYKNGGILQTVLRNLMKS